VGADLEYLLDIVDVAGIVPSISISILESAHSDVGRGQHDRAAVMPVVWDMHPHFAPGPCFAVALLLDICCEQRPAAGQRRPACHLDDSG
jgi:hypothetical protein